MRWGELAGLRRRNLDLNNRTVRIEDLHVHDLRHTGNSYAAETGASLVELMNRMGRSSTRAARIYLHARQERDKQIAATLDTMVKRELKREKRRAK